MGEELQEAEFLRAQGVELLIDFFGDLCLGRPADGSGEVVLEDGGGDLAFAADGGVVVEAGGDGFDGFDDVFFGLGRFAWAKEFEQEKEDGAGV